MPLLFYYNNDLCDSNYSIIDSSVWSSVNPTLFTALQTEKMKILQKLGLSKKIRM